LLERGVDYTATNGTSVSLTSALVAGDISTVASPSSFSVANAIPLSQFTAKGDILVGTGASTEAALNVGADGTTLVANSSSSTGVAWAGPIATAGKNTIINGGFDIWQRGTSVGTSSNNIYWADRWSNSNGGGNAITTSRQSSGLTGLQYCARIQRNSGTSNTSGIYITHSIETANSIPLAGKTVTFSFYARAGANFSASGSSMVYAVQSGTGTDESISVGYTGSSTLVSNTVTLTTSWQRFTATASVGSTATELGVYFGFTPTGTAGTNDYFELTGVQLEVGSVATAFSRNASTLQGELAACQRYYWRNTAGGSYSRYALGIGSSSSQVWFQVYNPVPMRVSPTSIDYANLRTDDTGSGQTITALGFTGDGSNPYTCNVYANVSSGITQFRPYILENNGNTAGYIGFSAEL